MTLNISQFLTPPEHAIIDHETLPGVLSPTEHLAVDHEPLASVLSPTEHTGTNHSGIAGVGKVVQQVRSLNFAQFFTVGNFLVGPFNVRPTTADGTLILTAAITPQNAANILVFEMMGSGSGGGGTWVIPVLFQTAGPGSSTLAITVGFAGESAGIANNMDCTFGIDYFQPAGSSGSLLTFVLHVAHSGNVNVPGFAGFQSTCLRITEYLP